MIILLKFSDMNNYINFEISVLYCCVLYILVTVHTWSQAHHYE